MLVDVVLSRDDVTEQPRNHSLFPKSSSSTRPLGTERVTWNNTPKSLTFLVFRETQTNKALSEIVLLNVA